MENAHFTFQSACTAHERGYSDEEEAQMHALANERRFAAQVLFNTLVERERHAYINTKGVQKYIRINREPPLRARLLAKLFRFDI